ncbi:hypothetical protein ACIP6P_00670 [Streptomyces sp. NPDC088729]|uniref:deoxynucleotide monophosphate kinase family protein n=1 Tax=Streptomyces sp. NPDC088729 TaxID=3365876 RepID=UPI0037F2614E
MSYQHVAFIGKARSGKDTAGQRLVQHWNFTRLAFADPLKRMALQINPYVPTGYGVTVRLESLIADVGWERAKEDYLEVRRILQHAGQTVRDHDEDFWVRVLMANVRVADQWNMPVVVTDVRYRNEALTLKAHGFRLVRITRTSVTGRTRSLDRHRSETELDDFTADETLINGGSVFDLHTLTDTLVRAR